MAAKLFKPLRPNVDIGVAWMKISYVGFSRGLDKIFIYVYNDLAEDEELTGVYVNGEDFTGKAEFFGRILRMKLKSLVTVPARLRRGSFVTVEVRGSKTSARETARVIPPLFPVGVYGASSVLESRYTVGEAIDMGFDTLVGGPGDLEKARQYGFRMVAYAPRKGDEVDVDVIRDYAAKYPNLLAWYVVDEPSAGIINKVVGWTDAVRKADPVNPAFIVHFTVRQLELHAKVPDVLGVDPYPVSRIGLDHVSVLTGLGVRYAAPRPVWLIPQAFRFARPTSEGDWPWRRFPHPEEERIMVYKGLGKGAKGVLYYTFYSVIHNENGSVEGLNSHNPDCLELRRGIARMSAELHALGEYLALGDNMTHLWNMWTRTGLVEGELLLAGSEALIAVLVSRNYFSGEYRFKIKPVEDIEVRVAVPEWMPVADVFILTPYEAQDVEYRQKGFERVFGKLYDFKIPRLDSAAFLVISGRDGLREDVEKKLKIWMRH